MWNLLKEHYVGLMREQIYSFGLIACTYMWSYCLFSYCGCEGTLYSLSFAAQYAFGHVFIVPIIRLFMKKYNQLPVSEWYDMSPHLDTMIKVWQEERNKKKSV